MLLEAKQQSNRKSKHIVNPSQGMKKKCPAVISLKGHSASQKKSTRADHNFDSSCMENGSDDAEGIYCGELLNECNDDTIQYTACLKWEHAVCAGRDDDELFVTFVIKLVVC